MRRICNVCGKPIEWGCMTDDCPTFYAHEECFSKYMDDMYGKGKWKATKNSEDDGYGGYYLAQDENGEWDGTGIYYTEYDDCEEGS